MPASRSWSEYRLDYRSREMKILAGWIQAGISGTVVGSAGIGKSNLLGFICQRPDALSQYLPAGSRASAVIAVDLNNLPADDTSTLYRVILRSFHESRGLFDTQLQQTVTALYLENRSARDPFLPQSALRELLLAFQGQRMRVVLVLDRFDWFCQNVEPQMTDTLRGLRDSFKDTISYIAGMRLEASYFSDPAALGELYELLDSHVCWVRPMTPADAGQLIADETSDNAKKPGDLEVERLLDLTGGYPSLLKVSCHWWSTTTELPDSEWVDYLLERPTIQHRLEKIWRSLTLVEQQTLGEIQKRAMVETAPDLPGRFMGDGITPKLHQNRRQALSGLASKGLIRNDGDGWQIGASLVAAYAGRASGRSPGAIWFDESTDTAYQGQTALRNLTPLEHRLLRFLIRHPRARHTHTDLIEAVWPEDTIKEGVSTEALYQVVRGLRRKIEPLPPEPRYVINWRGTPEGGYCCFPEGRPG